MASSRLQPVTRALGAPAPESLTQLDDTKLEHLAGALHGARHRQRAQMGAATESALQHVPLLLRGAVKKILGIK